MRCSSRCHARTCAASTRAGETPQCWKNAATHFPYVSQVAGRGPRSRRSSSNRTLHRVVTAVAASPSRRRSTAAVSAARRAERQRRRDGRRAKRGIRPAVARTTTDPRAAAERLRSTLVTPSSRPPGRSSCRPGAVDSRHAGVWVASAADGNGDRCSGCMSSGARPRGGARGGTAASRRVDVVSKGAR